MSTRHIHLDAVGGVAGDMFIAATIDAFPEFESRIFSDATAVLPRGLQPRFDRGSSGGISVLRFSITGQAEHAHAHRHGSFRDLRKRIEDADLCAGTSAHAIAILTALARVEAAIHGVALDDVHFHEIADWDSLADVVAAGSIIAALDARWSVSALPIGGGTVKTAHGVLPVPAPATAMLLKGFNWRDDGIPGERVTPTGAAILNYVTSGAVAIVPDGRLAAIGTGAGSRQLPGTPNILRVLAFELDASQRESVVALSFDVDDMTGEEIGVATDRLRECEGVIDLSIEMLLGKKGRPLNGFRLLVKPEALEAVKAACLAETSTLGIRWHTEQRAILPRSIEAAVVGGREVRVKGADRAGCITRKVESDDLAAIGGLEARRRFKAKAEREGNEK
jgi:pyridinium-3,5-bisthiocarboxylic acid mononucleotide nickel chelatase